MESPDDAGVTGRIGIDEKRVCLFPAVFDRSGSSETPLGFPAGKAEPTGLIDTPNLIEIEIALYPPQRFLANHIAVPQLNDRPPRGNAKLGLDAP